MEFLSKFKNKKIIINNIFFLNWNIFNLILILLKEILLYKFLMSAFLNYISLINIILNNFLYYNSRSKNNFWFKGKYSKNFQIFIFFYIDCDMDLILIFIFQYYLVCCHTNYFYCNFYKII